MLHGGRKQKILEVNLRFARLMGSYLRLSFFFGYDTDGEAVIMLAFQASGRGSTPLQCKIFPAYLDHP